MSFQSRSYQSGNPNISIAARTRSMSRRSTAASVSLTPCKTTGHSRNPSVNTRPRSGVDTVAAGCRSSPGPSVAIKTTLKRKADIQNPAENKKPRQSLAPETPSTPDQPPKVAITTPPASTRITIVPTPARDMLRAKYDVDDDNSDILSQMQPRPPTPPRVAERTPRNGYLNTQTPKRPHSPEYYEKLSMRRLVSPEPSVVYQNDCSPLRQMSKPNGSRGSSVISLKGGLGSSSTQSTSSTSKCSPIAKGIYSALVSLGDQEGEDSQATELHSTTATLPKAAPLRGAPATSQQLATTSLKTDPSIIPSRILKPSSTLIPRIKITGSEELQMRAGSVAQRPQSSRPLRGNSAPTKRLPPTRPSGGKELVNPILESARRKPSYPATLGSGPLARPNPRVVSNPVFSSKAISTYNPSAASAMEIDPVCELKSPRSVSDPVLPHSSSGHSTFIPREGCSDQSRNLKGLSEALERLKMRRSDNADVARPRSSMASKPLTEVVIVSKPADQSFKQSSAVPVTNRQSRPSLASLPVRPVNLSSQRDPGNDSMIAGTKSLAVLMSSSTGTGIFKGVTAFVDVKTAEGDDAGAVFADILKASGARVLSRPTESCTHIIYKTGKPSTLSWYRKLSDERPHVVGIKWITRSKEAGRRVAEDDYLVDLAKEDIFQKAKVNGAKVIGRLKRRTKDFSDARLNTTRCECPSKIHVICPKDKFAAEKGIHAIL